MKLENIKSLFLSETDKPGHACLGWLLFGVALLIGIWNLRWGWDDGEADILVVGSLIARGHLVYGDIFSHHFPFPYFWVAGLIRVFGPSIYIIRFLSLFFQIVILGVTARLSRLYLTAGIATLVWSLLRPLYRLNRVTYQAFSSLSIAVIFLLCLAILTDQVKLKKRHWILVGIFEVIAFLSDPLTAYPLIFLNVYLLVIRREFALKSGYIAAAGLSVFILYLLITGTFRDFFNQAITFNADVYSAYNKDYSNINRLPRIWANLRSVMDLKDWSWVRFDPFREIPEAYTEFDRWAFSGFFYRLAIVLFSTILTIRKHYAAAVFVFLFALINLGIESFDFRASSFAFVGIISGGAVVTQELFKIEDNIKWVSLISACISLVLGVMFIWLGLRLIVYTRDNLSDRVYISEFIRLERESQKLHRLACEDPDARLAFYPSNIYPYWFSEMEPFYKYLYMWPWIAEVGLTDVIQELQKNPKVIVVRTTNGLVFGQFDTRDYLRPLDQYLEAEYFQKADGIYISPALQEYCESK